MLTTNAQEAVPALTVCMVGEWSSVHMISREKALKEAGVTVLRAPSSRICPPRSGLLTRIPKLRALVALCDLATDLRRQETDIFHVQFAVNLPGWVLAVTRDRPLVVSLWGGDVFMAEQHSGGRGAAAITRELIETADLVTVESEFIAEQLDAKGIRPQRLAIVNWGIDLDLFTPQDSAATRSRLSIPGDAFLFYSPKILAPMYNIDLLVEAFGRVSTDLRDCHLMIGTHRAVPDYLESIRARVRTLRLDDRVVFLPDMPTRELPALYSAADVSVALPMSDGVPRSMFESMACGSANLTGFLPSYEPFLRHGENALLVPIEVDAVEAGMRRLHGDPDLRQHIIENGLCTVHTFADQHREASRMVDEYRELLRHGAQLPSFPNRLRIAAHLLLALAFSAR